jgi:autotransporter-associated beta strand protein
MSRFPIVALILLSLCLGTSRLLAQTPIPSFPGAVGYGGTATGAWTLSGTNHVGGKVYYVTNLNASGAGSFAAGVATGGNIVEFQVGGDIFLDGPVTVASNVSIEGQTAPGGIMIYGGELSCYGHSNIICRYLHSEDGTEDPNYPGSSSTNSSANAANLGNSTGCIFDHCSFEFASYNNIDASGTGSTNNLTFQYCIFADPILEQRFNLHIQATNVTVIGNLFANSGGRNPLAKTNMQYVNNVAYNYLYAVTTGDSADVCSWDIINNYFIPGPSNTNTNDTFYQIDSNQSAYAVGNYQDTNNDGTLNGANTGSTVGGATTLSTYYSTATTSLPTLSATGAFYYVTSVAGPLPHDQVDSQVVTQVLSLGSQGRLFNGEDDTNLGNGGYGTITGGNPLQDSDNSGMPDDWRAAVGISMTNPAISGSTSSTGYTYLENYLAWAALPNGWIAKNTTAQPSSLSINLSNYAGGFATNATYTASGATGGTISQSGAGGQTVTFTPTVNSSGLGGFSWSVTNGITTMSSTFGVLISQTGPAQPVVWKGDGTTNAWNTTSNNWTVESTGSTTAFATNDPVVFSDTGSASPAIAISSTVLPGTISFDNNTNNYTLSGTGAISGAGAFIMDGAATVTINNTGANGWSGGTIIDSGTIAIPNVLAATALGSSTVTLNGGALELTSTGSFMFGNTLNINQPSTLILNGNNNTYLNSTITGNANLTLNFLTNILFTPQDSFSSYSGAITAVGSGSIRFNDSSAWGFPASVLNLNGPITILNRATAAATIPLGELNGISTAVLEGSNQTTTGPVTYSLGSLNLPSTFAGIIENSASQVTGIAWTGTNLLTLSGDCTYTGTTAISKGTFLLTGTLGNTNLIISSGATFISNTYVSGSANLNSGASLYIGSSTASNNVGTLTLGSGFGLSGGTLYYTLSNSPTATGSNDLITVSSGNVNLSGAFTFNINPINTLLSSGTYPLINSSNGAVETASSPTMTLAGLPGNTRQTYTLYRPPSGSTLGLTGTGLVGLVVTGAPASLTWIGGSGASWDLNNSPDWIGGTPNTFFNLDTVTFDDTDSGGGTVVLTGTLDAYAVYVNNNVNNYTFSGAGGIAGNGQLVKTGTGSLTIANTGNVFTGPIYLNAGTLCAQGSLGAGTLYLNGGTLSVSGSYPSISNSIVVNANSTIDDASGTVFLSASSGALFSSGSNPVTLNFTFDTPGAVCAITGSMGNFVGTIAMGNATGLLCFGGSNSNNNAGTSQALFDLGTASAGLCNYTGNASVNLGAVQSESPTTYLSGRLSGSGATASTYYVGALNTNNTFPGYFTDGGDQLGINLTKVGTGTWTLSGTSNFLGIILVQQGTLTITGSDNNGGQNFEAEAGSTFTLAGGTVTTFAVTIDPGAIFTGNGAINGDFVNNGTATVSGSAPLTINGDFDNEATMTVNAGSPLTINGNYLNNGTMMVDGSSSLAVKLPSGGSGFINNGLLDIMDSPQTVLPAGYVNDGTILTSALVTVQSITKTGSNFSATIQSYSGHTYQLEKSTDLNSWQTVGTLQAGTGSAIILSDTNASTGSSFYKIGVGP